MHEGLRRHTLDSKWLREILNIPKDDFIVVIHVERSKLERVVGALELAGITEQEVNAITDKGIYSFDKN